jgi:hypothetical protein
MAFTQIIEVQIDDVEAIENHVSEWHRDQKGIAPGYEATRVLADCSRPGTYFIEVEFDSEEDAKKNDARLETGDWARRIRTLLKSDPSYRNLTEVCTTERN